MANKKTSTQSYLSIKNYSNEDKPREKLIQQGKHSLTKAELLGIIINTGLSNMNAVDLARNILNQYDNNLTNIARFSVQELMKFQGIGQAKAVTIVGVLELASRLQKDIFTPQTAIKTSRDIYNLMQEKLVTKVVEEFWAISLNNQHQVIKTSQISKGGLSKTTVDINILFKECLLNNATFLVLVHNHPSGSIQPSLNDIELTKKVITAGKTLHIKVIEHLIFTNTKYFSFADEGMIDALRLSKKVKEATE